MNFSSYDEARQLLGLPADVRLSEIKTSYRDFLKTYHPDANPGMYGTVGEITPGSAMDAYLKMKAAYEYLIDHYETTDTVQEDIPAENKPSSPQTQMDACRSTLQMVGASRVFGAKADLSDLAFQKRARADHVRAERRSRERAKKEKASFDEKMKQYQSDKAYEKAMTQIHVQRVAEITAQMIEAYLQGKL